VGPSGKAEELSEAETFGLNEAAAGKSSPPVTTADSARSAGRVPAIVVGLFVVAAAFTRFYHLGDRPLHHDESIHAHQSYSLMKDGNWRYDPAYHGPFLYYANALVYKIAGVNNTTARSLPAVFGILLMGFAWPLSRWIGKTAAVAYALLVLISPHIAYSSRFIREDLYSLVFTFGTILAFRYFLETGRDRVARQGIQLACITRSDQHAEVLAARLLSDFDRVENAH
jgi:uncharacterized protein (TIGR03663 family)